MTTTARPTRPGISLLEVLVALAVFLIALIGIGRLLSFASDRALDVKLQAEAIKLCQSKMAEAVAGVIPLQGGSGSFDEAPDWEWSLEAEQPGNVTGLYTVTVRVRPTRSDGAGQETTLVQMILDPSLRGAAPNPTALSNMSSASGGAGGGGGGGGGAGAGAAGAAGRGGAMGGGAVGGARGGPPGAGGPPGRPGAPGGGMGGPGGAPPGGRGPMGPPGGGRGPGPGGGRGGGRR